MKSTEKRSVLVFSFLSGQVHKASPSAPNYHKNTLYFCYHKSQEQTDHSVTPVLIATRVRAMQTQLVLGSPISTFANEATREREVA